MLTIIKKDWQTSWHIIIGIAVYLFLISFLGSDMNIRSLAVLGLICSGILPLLIWVKELKCRGRVLTCSLPVDRNTFVQGSFLSSWTFSFSMFLIAILLILVKSLIFPAESAHLREILELKVLILSLWIPTGMFLLFFTLYSWKNAGFAMITFLIVFLTGICSIIVNQIATEDTLACCEDPFLIAFLKSSVMFIFSHHGTGIGLVISIVLLVLVNIWTVKFSEFLFARNEIAN